MSNWFECKVTYDKTQEDGAVRKTTESFLVDAMSFTEAEARITEEREPFISGEFEVTAVKRTKIAEIVWDETGDRWYLAKLVFLETDPKSGKEKRSVSQILVEAKDFKTALDNLMENMKGYQTDVEIASINETQLMDVYKVKLDK